MKYLKKFNEIGTNENLFSRFLGGDKIDPAKQTAMKSQGYSHIGKNEDEQNYIMYQGQKFYQEDIEYDDYHSTKPLPRIEGNKLIIANPIWQQ